MIQIPDERARELSKVCMVRLKGFVERSEEEVVQSIFKHVANHKPPSSREGWDFLYGTPKSPTEKILRRLLRDREKEKRRREGMML